MAVRRLNEGNSTENVKAIQRDCHKELDKIIVGLQNIRKLTQVAEEAVNSYNEADDGSIALEIRDCADDLVAAIADLQESATYLRQFIGFCDIY